MRDDIRQALRGRTVSFLGAYREIRKLTSYLHEGERVDDIAACKFDTAKGRAIVVATDERILVIKNGWIFRSSQGMAYKDVRSIDINTGVFFASIDFHGEGVDPFKISEVGRFSADHIVKLIRERTGSRYSTWERKHQAEKNQQQQAAQQPTPPPSFPVSPPQTQAFPHLSDRLEDYVGLSSPSLDPVSFPSPQHVPDSANPNVQQLHFPPTQPVAVPQRNLLAELEKLENDHNNGLMSDGQFNLAKRKLLGG